MRWFCKHEAGRCCVRCYVGVWSACGNSLIRAYAYLRVGAEPSGDVMAFSIEAADSASTRAVGLGQAGSRARLWNTQTVKMGLEVVFAHGVDEQSHVSSGWIQSPGPIYCTLHRHLEWFVADGARQSLSKPHPCPVLCIFRFQKPPPETPVRSKRIPQVDNSLLHRAHASPPPTSHT